MKVKQHDSALWVNELRGNGSVSGYGIGVGNIYSGIRRHNEQRGHGVGSGDGAGSCEIHTLVNGRKNRGERYGAGQGKVCGINREQFEEGGSY